MLLRTYIFPESDWWFSFAYVLPFLRICEEICARFGNGVMQRHAVKKGFALVFLGTIGFILECISAMEYYQGKHTTVIFILCNYFKNSRDFYVIWGIRLSLISSETAITTLLFILCLCKSKWFFIKSVLVISHWYLFTVVKHDHDFRFSDYYFSDINLFQLANISSQMGCYIWWIHYDIPTEFGTKVSRLPQYFFVHIKCPCTRCNLSILKNILSIAI